MSQASNGCCHLCAESASPTNNQAEQDTDPSSA